MPASEYISDSGAVISTVTTAKGPVSIDKVEGTLVPTPGPNRALPPINPLKVRSTIAATIGIIQTLMPLVGTEGGLATALASIVSNEETIQAGASQVVAGLDVLIGAGSWVWFWLERRAPNRRLTFRTK